jgi:hypothetical protein
MEEGSVREAAEAFVSAINRHDVTELVALMSEDHAFIDAVGGTATGREIMRQGWTGYFEWFPDYWIDFAEVLVSGNRVKMAKLPILDFQTRSCLAWATDSVAAERTGLIRVSVADRRWLTAIGSLPTRSKDARICKLLQGAPDSIELARTAWRAQTVHTFPHHTDHLHLLWCDGRSAEGIFILHGGSW